MKNPGNLRNLLTYAETAKLIGVAEPTVRRWVMLRKIPFIKLGRSVRFHPQALKGWIEERSVPVGTGR